MSETNKSAVAWLTSSDAYDTLCLKGYTRLDQCPEVVTACRAIAQVIGSMTIYLMENTDRGDQRIQNELSRKLDIEPNAYMTRKTFVETLVMNELLYGRGNSIVLPVMARGLIDDLVPIPPGDVSFQADGYGYKVIINGDEFDPSDVLHFTHNPDPNYPWKGTGFHVLLREIVRNLAQARKTEKGFLGDKWKPSVIVKVDGLTPEFADKEGRQKLKKEFLDGNEAGEPWMIPAGLLEVEQVRPLSLQDLAIADVYQLNKRTVAAALGVPAFLLGVGEYNQEAWNSFIQHTVAPIAKGIEQELTKKLILSPKWYVHFNVTSVYDYDLKTISDVYGTLADKGFVTGNEVRDKINLSPMDGLDELRILENYIPADRIGDQNKLGGPSNED